MTLVVQLLGCFFLGAFIAVHLILLARLDIMRRRMDLERASRLEWQASVERQLDGLTPFLTALLRDYDARAAQAATLLGPKPSVVKPNAPN